MSELAAALNKALGIIEFDRNGYVIGANERFLEMMGYTLEEVRDCHHSMFCDPAYAESVSYKAFWADLLGGRIQAGEFQRYGKNGRMVWLHASYTPVHDAAGKLRRIVKFATDITPSKLVSVEFEALTQAVNRVHAVVEYDLKGQVLNANRNFLELSGYTLDEIRGRHDSLFCKPDEAASQGFQQMWQHLAAGGSEGGEYERIGKDGRELWLEAWYTPIIDAAGQPCKVVQFASDITERKREEKRTQEALRLTSRVARIGTWELELETCQLSLSEMGRELLGIERTAGGNLFADMLARLKHPERMLDAIAAAKASRQGWEFDQELREQAGGTRLVRWIGIPRPSAPGVGLTVVGTVQDIGEQSPRGLQRLQRPQDVEPLQLPDAGAPPRIAQAPHEELGTIATLQKAYRRWLYHS